MKIRIKYLKTGKTEERQVNEVFYTDRKIGIVWETGFSVFYPSDMVEITILPK